MQWFSLHLTKKIAKGKGNWVEDYGEIESLPINEYSDTQYIELLRFSLINIGTLLSSRNVKCVNALLYVNNILNTRFLTCWLDIFFMDQACKKFWFNKNDGEIQYFNLCDYFI